MRERIPEGGGRQDDHQLCRESGAPAKQPPFCKSAELVELSSVALRLGQEIELCGCLGCVCARLCVGVPDDDGEGGRSTCVAPSTRLAFTLPWACHQSPFLGASPLLPSTPYVSWSHSSLVFPSFSSRLFGFG